jgi:hypothetical protein
VFLAIADDFYDRLEMAIAGSGAGLPTNSTDGRSFLRASFHRWFEFFHLHRLAATVMLKEGAAIDPRFDRGIAELRQSAYTHFAERVRRFHNSWRCARTARHRRCIRRWDARELLPAFG